MVLVVTMQCETFFVPGCSLGGFSKWFTRTHLAKSTADRMGLAPEPHWPVSTDQINNSLYAVSRELVIVPCFLDDAEVL